MNFQSLKRPLFLIAVLMLLHHVIVQAQTPWTSNIDGAQYNLSNVKKLSVFKTYIPSENLLTNSEVLSSSNWGTGNFTITDNQANDLDGNLTLDEVNSGWTSSNGMGQSVTVTPGDTLFLSWDVKRKTGGITDVNYGVYDLSHFNYVVSPTSYYSSTGSSVSRMQISFTVPAGCTEIKVFPFADIALTGAIYIGRVQLAAHSSSGYLTTTTAAASGGSGTIHSLSTDDNGNVGIGTASPTEKLHVIGNTLVTGNISSPGTGTGSEKFGENATVNANNYSVAIGHDANTVGHESVAIGSSAKADLHGVSVGANAIAGGFASTIVGYGVFDNNQPYVTSVGASNTNPIYFSGGSYLNSGMINIGYNNSSADNYTWLIGANLTTDRPNQMLIGNGLAGGFLTDVVLGGGLSNSLASNYGPVTIRTTDGSGANSAGMPLSFRAGKGTGSATGGSLSFFTTPAGSSGSTLNTEVERMRIDPNGAILFNGAAGSAGQVLTSGGAGAPPSWAAASSIGLVSASNGLVATSGDVKLGGSLTGHTKIINGSSNIWFKTNFNSTQRADLNNADGHIIIGDSNRVPITTFETSNPTSGQGIQNGAALIVSKTKYNNNENVSLLTLTTADAATRNGWAFFNYTNSAGYVSPRLMTYSNTNDAYGYSHDVFSKDNSTWPAYQIKLLNYDTLNLNGTVYSKIRNRNLFLISNGQQGGPINNLFQIDSLGGWSGDIYKNTDSNKVLTADGNGNIKFKTLLGNGASQWTVVGNNIYNTNITGSIGVGTVNINDTAYKLFVEKGIRTRKVKVDIVSWPDYVFHKNYKLPSLNDLEAYLLKNNHLPDVPPAAEVEKNGIDLGDNQALLLKKVEELTLYMIELNKKVEALSKENEQLKKKVNGANQ